MPALQFSDSINLLSKLTYSRVVNGGKVLGSYYYSRLTGNAIQIGLPVSVSIEPTTSCNLRCPECPSGLRSFTRETGMLEPDFFRKTIDELSNHLCYLLFYFQGEPYLHPDFLSMVHYASEKGIYTATSTNAHFLNDESARKTVESGLDRLIISIDGTTQEVYESYRIGGQLQKVLEGTRNIIKWKKQLQSKTPHLIFQFLVVSKNEHQINAVKKLAKETGVNEVRFKTAQLYDFKNGNELIPVNEKFSRYRKQQDGSFAIKNKLMNHCWKLWHSSVITWDGKVVPCCFDKDAKYRLGDLNSESFASIWQSDGYQRFRSAVLRSRKEIDICANCSEGTTVWG
ncbi:MAG: SPASM domain-containing protein [Chitinophagaceae bacterium]|nr:SPASM domain-containing protein [Chitinophagaceae bacterium]